MSLFMDFQEREEGGGERAVCCSSHWGIIGCFLDVPWQGTHSLGVSGRCSNQLRYPARAYSLALLTLVTVVCLRYLPRMYLNYNWQFDLLPTFTPTSPTLLTPSPISTSGTTNLFSVSMSSGFSPCLDSAYKQIIRYLSFFDLCHLAQCSPG